MPEPKKKSGRLELHRQCLFVHVYVCYHDRLRSGRVLMCCNVSVWVLGGIATQVLHPIMYMCEGRLGGTATQVLQPSIQVCFVSTLWFCFANAVRAQGPLVPNRLLRC